jgi:hypothetical protein
VSDVRENARRFGVESLAGWDLAELLGCELGWLCGLSETMEVDELRGMIVATA